MDVFAFVWNPTYCNESTKTWKGFISTLIATSMYTNNIELLFLLYYPDVFSKQKFFHICKKKKIVFMIRSERKGDIVFVGFLIQLCFENEKSKSTWNRIPPTTNKFPAKWKSLASSIYKSASSKQGLVDLPNNVLSKLICCSY